jgi:hypothetical protein
VTRAPALVTVHWHTQQRDCHRQVGSLGAAEVAARAPRGRGESAWQGRGGESSPWWRRSGEAVEPLGAAVLSLRQWLPTMRCRTMSCESLRWSRGGHWATWWGREGHRAASRHGGGASDRHGGDAASVSAVLDKRKER